MTQTPGDPAPAPLPATVRILQWLVIGLTASLIIGVITMVTVLVIRLPRPATPPVPEELALPAGAVALSFSQGRDWVAVTTTDDRILIYDRNSGALRQTLIVTGSAEGGD